MIDDWLDDWPQEERAEQVPLGDLTVEIVQQVVYGRHRVLVTPFYKREIVTCQSGYVYNAMIAVPIDENIQAFIKGMARAAGYKGPVVFNNDGQIKSALDEDDDP